MYLYLGMYVFRIYVLRIYVFMYVLVLYLAVTYKLFALKLHYYRHRSISVVYNHKYNRCSIFKILVLSLRLKTEAIISHFGFCSATNP